MRKKTKTSGAAAAGKQTRRRPSANKPSAETKRVEYDPVVDAKQAEKDILDAVRALGTNITRPEINQWIRDNRGRRYDFPAFVGMINELAHQRKLKLRDDNKHIVERVLKRGKTTE